MKTLHDEIVAFLDWQEAGAESGSTDDVAGNHEELAARYIEDREASRPLPTVNRRPVAIEEAAAHELTKSGWDVFEPWTPA